MWRAEPGDQVSRRSRILSALAHGPAAVYGPAAEAGAWTGMPMTQPLQGHPAALSVDSDHDRRRQAQPGMVHFNGGNIMHMHLGKRLLSTADFGIALLLLGIVGSAAHAFSAPAQGDLGYDIYDIVVNQGVKGPLGFVGGVAAFLFGVSRLFSNIMIGIPTIVAAVCLIRADSILQTFGMTI